MPADTTNVRNNQGVNTPPWKFRVDPELKDEAIRVAKTEGDNLTSVLLRGMRAYIANPAAYNAACANIIEESRR
jgi:hypothetical protein